MHKKNLFTVIVSSILVILFIFSLYKNTTIKKQNPVSDSTNTIVKNTGVEKPKNTSENSIVYSIPHVTIYAYEKKIFEGTRDITEEVNRILKKQTSADVVFGNREKILPLKPKNYYHEYDLKTPNWPYSNRGPERIVLGRQGEIYYTSDHYASFIKLK